MGVIFDKILGRLRQSDASSIAPIEITYNDLDTLKNNSELAVGYSYKITDRGGQGIITKALSINELARKCTRFMNCPTSYTPSGTFLGVWNNGLVPALNDTVVWGGRVWIQNNKASAGALFNFEAGAQFGKESSLWYVNGDVTSVIILGNPIKIEGREYSVDGFYHDGEHIVDYVEFSGGKTFFTWADYTMPPDFELSGNVPTTYPMQTVLSQGTIVVPDPNVGTAIDDFTLDANWELVEVPYGETNANYVLKQFEIWYDFNNDWIELQKDGSGNEVGIDFATKQDWGFDYNPADVTDWMYSGGLFYGNKVKLGWFNNSAMGYFNSNEGFGSISNNTSGDIYSNKQKNGDDAEFIVGNITPDIINNNNCKTITYNKNNGAISDNDCVSIDNNPVTVNNIINNNGNVVINASAIVGDISDPITNK